MTQAEFERWFDHVNTIHALITGGAAALLTGGVYLAGGGWVLGAGVGLGFLLLVGTAWFIVLILMAGVMGLDEFSDDAEATLIPYGDQNAVETRKELNA